MENKNNDGVEIVKHGKPAEKVIEPVTDMEDFKLKSSYMELRDKAREIISKDVARIKSIDANVAAMMTSGPIKTIEEPEKELRLMLVMALKQGEDIFKEIVKATEEGKPQDQKEGLREVVEKLKVLVSHFGKEVPASQVVEKELRVNNNNTKNTR